MGRRQVESAYYIPSRYMEIKRNWVGRNFTYDCGSVKFGGGKNYDF